MFKFHFFRYAMRFASSYLDSVTLIPLGTSNVTSISSSFFQIKSKAVEINGVHYINPQFRVMKRFKIDDEVDEMYDSIRMSFICVLHKYFMLRDLQMEETILRLERIDCTDPNQTKYVMVSDVTVKL